jgi:hypothetical protein
MKWSSFRGWVHNLWVENCEEHLQDRRPKDSEREYFNKYRWWLKREFKHQMMKERKKNEQQARFAKFD